MGRVREAPVASPRGVEVNGYSRSMAENSSGIDSVNISHVFFPVLVVTNHSARLLGQPNF